MADDLTTSLRRAGTAPAAPVDPAAIRGQADRRRRRTTTILSVALVLLLTTPVVALMGADREEVRIDQPSTSEPTTSEPTTSETAAPEPAATEPATGPAAPDDAASGNAAVYRMDIAVEARIDGPLADVVQVATVDDDARYGGLGIPGEVVLVLTADRTLQLDLTATDPTAEDQGVQPPVVGASVARLVGTDVVVDRGTTTLRAGEPTLVRVDMTQTGVMDFPDTSSAGVTAVLDLEDPDIAAAADAVDDVRITLTPRPRTGDDLGIPGAQDIPDQRLPLPSVGEAIPTQLADGTPVWVVGLGGGAVSVVGARSPHTPSGLVGWCGTLPGFIDAPGAARFAPTGTYAFGPAPWGLTPYETRVEGDQVVVTGRLAPRPRPGLSGYPQDIPPIEGSPVQQTGACEPGADAMRRGVEDYRGVEGWVQHDLDDWPRFDGQADGWFHADSARLALGEPPTDMAVTGDLLIHRVEGVTVDAAGPPGSTTSVVPAAPVEPPRRLDLLVDVGDGPYEGCPPEVCPHGSVALLEVVWVTPDGIADVTDEGPPSSGAVLYPRFGDVVQPRSLTEGATIDADIGDLVAVSLDDEGYAVTAVHAVP